MLRYLMLSNWKSIYDPIEFSMNSTNERRHGERLARVGRSRLLPVAAIYGANAAGKSALVEGLAVLQVLVTERRSKGDPLPVVPHKLKGKGEATSFGVEFVVAAPNDSPGRRRDWVFYYELTADRHQIHRESLMRLRSKDEEVLFEREGNRVEFFGDLEEDLTSMAIKRLLTSNQTVLGFLGDLGDGPKLIDQAWRWFSEQLKIIGPRSNFIMLPARIAADELFADAMNHGLSAADTGISKIDLEDLPVGAVLPPNKVQEIEDRLSVDNETLVLYGQYGEYGLLSLDASGSLRAQRLVTVHESEPGADGESKERFTLTLSEESDGTARFMHLLPMLFQLAEGSSRGVFIVDELENSMHPLLTEKLVRAFLDGLNADDRRQLVFTTHELRLMQIPLLRRDEMWLADKLNGQTRLARMSEYSRKGVRKDADILGLYTSGRLGGVPRI